MTLRSLAIGAALLSILAGRAYAQTRRDQIVAGYDLMHRGDAAGASKYFEALQKSVPNDLAVRFGWIMAERERIDFDSARVGPYEKGLDSIIELADARYGRTHEDTEALFYLANAHLVRAAYRFDHDKGMWGAARDGAKAKGYIDTYVKKYPADVDAYFVLGTYNYYADILPTLFKFVRFFLFIPSGDRVEGLKQIERSSKGALFGPLARLMLMDIFAEFEGRPDDAIKVGEDLRSQYPAS